MCYAFLLLCLLNSLLIDGREGKPLYTLQVPSDWEAIQTPKEKIRDTTEPLITWRKGELEARLHSFPLQGASIPPEAQITRWLKKFSTQPAYQVIPVSQGGYTGLILITEDFLGAAFSLGERGKSSFRNHPEVCSDWTFVVKGPAKELQREKLSILSWVETIQLPFEILYSQ